MAFVNEKISAADIEKYGLLKPNKSFSADELPAEWTIDRDRKVYLHAIGKVVQEQQQLFSFSWRGHLLEIRLTRTGCGIKGGVIFASFCVMSPKADKKVWLPHRLEWARNEIVLDLKKALNTFKNKGLTKDHKQQMQIEF